MVTIRKSTQVLLLIILFLPEFVSGQTLKNFSHDKVKFITEMETFLQATNKRKKIGRETDGTISDSMECR